MKAGKRFIVDTNTIISGILLSQSVPGRLLGHLAAHATLIFSPGQAEGLRRLHVHHQFEFGWLVDRQIARLRALEHLVDVTCGRPEIVGDVGAEPHKAALEPTTRLV